jgi:antitoxin component of RelBE/YafQ-DinJ toxin-antitoxin module
MKASMLISILARQIVEHSDLPVKVFAEDKGEQDILPMLQIREEPYYFGPGDGFDVPTKIVLYLGKDSEQGN